MSRDDPFGAAGVAELSGQEYIRIKSGETYPIPGDGPETGPHYRRDDPQLVSHVDTGGNVARVCRDDLIVIDIVSEAIDKHIRHLPDTLEIGINERRHIWYKCPEGVGSIKSIITSDDDLVGHVKTRNGYCLIPPSKHPSGSQYKVVENREVATVSRAAIMGMVAGMHQSFGVPSPSVISNDSSAVYRNSPADKDSWSAEFAVTADLRAADGLSFIEDDRRHHKLVECLTNPYALHELRYHLAYTLYAIDGVKKEDVFKLVDEYNKWDDYDPQVMRKQVSALIEESEYNRGGWSG